MAKDKVLICPYCGEAQPAADACRSCRGQFEPYSRQATHNAMGPWFVRDQVQPFRPGCSYETLIRLVECASVTKYSIIRGPTTRQFWTVARRVPGLAHLLGYCHHCDAAVEKDATECHRCGAAFGAFLDRNFLGLPDVRPLPWEAPGETHDDKPAAWSPRSAAPPPPTPPDRISSFATDEELISSDPRDPSTSTGSLQALSEERDPRHILPEHDDPDPAPATVEGIPATELLSSPAVRSMQRQIARHKRTIRVLTIVVIVVAVGAAIVNVATVLRLREQESVENQRPPSPAAPIDVVEKNAPPTTVPTNADPRPGDPAIVADAIDSDDFESPIPDVATPPDARDVDPAAAARAQLDHAKTLFLQGIDVARPLDRRKEDLRQALSILDGLVAADAPPPAGTLELAQQVRDELERIELQTFFP